MPESTDMHPHSQQRQITTLQQRVKDDVAFTKLERSRGEKTVKEHSDAKNRKKNFINKAKVLLLDCLCYVMNSSGEGEQSKNGTKGTTG